MSFKILLGTSYQSSISRRQQQRASIDDKKINQRFVISGEDVDDEDLVTDRPLRQRNVASDTNNEEVLEELIKSARRQRQASSSKQQNSNPGIRFINLPSTTGSDREDRRQAMISFDASSLHRHSSKDEKRLFFTLPSRGSKRSKTSQPSKFRIFAIEYDDEDDLNADQLSDETDDISGGSDTTFFMFDDKCTLHNIP